MQHCPSLVFQSCCWPHLSFFCLFFTSCLMTTPCQWFKLVTGFVLVTMVAQTGVIVEKQYIFKLSHLRNLCVDTVFS